MKYAIIGCGRISVNHIAAAINNGLDIVALVDINKEKVKEKISTFSLQNERINIYMDYHEMLEKEKPELVAIATESGKHARIALDCLDYGCNLIIEKPIALSIEDADAIIVKAKEKNVKVCACHQNRFNKSIHVIKKAMDEGRFGKLIYGTAHIRWNRGKSYYDQAKWRGTWEQDGGALMNQCIHNIDLLCWLMGDEVDSVYGVTDRLCHPYIEAEDLGISVIKFKNGAYGLIEGTTDIFPENLEETLYIFGEKGTVKAGGKSVNSIEEWKFADGLDDAEQIKKENSEIPPNIYGFGHTALYKNVIEAICGNEKLLIDAEAGKRALEIVLAIYKSSVEGNCIKLPLRECSTLEFRDRFRE